MFFSKLLPLLVELNLSFSISAKNDVVSVTIIPKTKDKNTSLTNTPLVMSGSVEEMDEKFIPELQKALAATTGFFSNTAQFVDGAKEKTTESKPVTSTAKITTPAAEKTTVAKEKVKLTAGQNKVLKNAGEAVEKAKKQADPDMITFLKNQTVKQLEDAKIDTATIDEIKASFDAIVPGAAKDNTAEAGSEELAPTHPDDLIDENIDDTDEQIDESQEEENTTATSTPAPNTAVPDDDIF